MIGFFSRMCQILIALALVVVAIVTAIWFLYHMFFMVVNFSFIHLVLGIIPLGIFFTSVKLSKALFRR